MERRFITLRCEGQVDRGSDSQNATASFEKTLRTETEPSQQEPGGSGRVVARRLGRGGFRAMSDLLQPSRTWQKRDSESFCLENPSASGYTELYSSNGSNPPPHFENSRQVTEPTTPSAPGTPAETPDSAKGPAANALVAIFSLASVFSMVRFAGTSFSIADAILTFGGAWVIARQLRRGDSAWKHLLRSCGGLLGVAAIFVVFALLSGATGLWVSGDAFVPARWLSGTLQYAYALGFLPVVAWAALRRSSLWTFLRLISLGHLIAMVPPLLTALPGVPDEWRAQFYFAGRATGVVGNANGFAMVLSLVFPFYLSLSLVDRGVWLWVGWLGILATQTCLILSASFGGALCFVVLSLAYAATAFVWRSHPLRFSAWRTCALIVTLAVMTPVNLYALLGSSVASPQISPRVSLLLDVPVSEWSEHELRRESKRLLLMQEAVGQIAERWGGFWGHGLNQSEMRSEHPYGVHETHLLLWVEGGVFLLLAFLAYILLLLRNVVGLGTTRPEVAIPIGFCLLAFVLNGFLHTHMYMRHIWVGLLPAMVCWQVPNWAFLPLPSRPKKREGPLKPAGVP